MTTENLCGDLKGLNYIDPKNPPAYPNAWDNDGAPGMTLRDHFAGCAIPALVALFGRDPAMAGATNERLAEAIAKNAGCIADAMLAERMEGKIDNEG